MPRTKGSPNKAGRKDSVRLTINIRRELMSEVDQHMVRTLHVSRTAAIEDLLEIGVKASRLVRIVKQEMALPYEHRELRKRGDADAAAIVAKATTRRRSK